MFLHHKRTPNISGHIIQDRPCFVVLTNSSPNCSYHKKAFLLLLVIHIKSNLKSHICLWLVKVNLNWDNLKLIYRLSLVASIFNSTILELLLQKHKTEEAKPGELPNTLRCLRPEGTTSAHIPTVRTRAREAKTPTTRKLEVSNLPVCPGREMVRRT